MIKNKKIMKSFVGHTYIVIAILILLFPNVSHANDCYRLDANNIGSIDLNGKDMWLHLTDIEKFLYNDVSCVVMGKQSFKVLVVEDDNTLLLKLHRPDLSTFKMFVATLAK